MLTPTTPKICPQTAPQTLPVIEDAVDPKKEDERQPERQTNCHQTLPETEDAANPIKEEEISSSNQQEHQTSCPQTLPETEDTANPEEEDEISSSNQQERQTSCPRTLPETEDTTNPEEEEENSSIQQERQTRWYRRLNELKEYKNTHGDVNVPRSYGPLGEWCYSQRRHINAYYNNESVPLTRERKEKLDALGFEWFGKRKMSNRVEMSTKKSRRNEDQVEVPILPAFLGTVPNTGHCKWTFDTKTRVLLAKYIGKGDFLCAEDEAFMMRMMERTDIALVSEGLLRNKSPLLDLQYLAKRLKGNVHHRCQHFAVARKTQKKFHAEHASNVAEAAEKSPHNVNMSIELSEYIDYIEKYRNAMRQENIVGDEAFQFSTMPQKKFHPSVDQFLLVDIDLKKILPEACSDFRDNFILRKCLPGGDACMMKSVSSQGQPPMGPNLHIGTPGTVIHFQRDGEGTVDSGHFCVDGFIEVVMLGRMTEEETRQALSFLYPRDESKRLLWPDYESIRKCDDMKCNPCVFVLKPGQFLHVNKGRMYSLRTASNEALDGNDCHKDLRKDLIENKNIANGSMCKIIAWDWMYLGTTEEGIQREVSETLMNARLAQKNEVQPLAIPERCIVAMAEHHLAYYEATAHRRGALLDLPLTPKPSDLVVLKGIYPCLKDILGRQINEYNEKIKASKKDPYVEVLSLSDAKKDPDMATIDPFGNDFNCKLCKKELSNTYMHCEGCEILLQKDFNICTDCHANDNLRLKNVTMHPTRPLRGVKNNGSNAGRRADYNHMPGTNREQRKNCSCKNGPPCRQCGYMICCSCKCHKKYSLRTRFHDVAEINSLLNDVRSAIGVELDDLDSCIEENKGDRNTSDTTLRCRRSVRQQYAHTKSRGGTTVLKRASSLDIEAQLISNDIEKNISQSDIRRKSSEKVSEAISKQDIGTMIEDKMKTIISKSVINKLVEKKVRELDSRRKASERRSEAVSMKNIKEMMKKEVQEIDFTEDIETLQLKVEGFVENEKDFYQITERKIREIQDSHDKAIEALQQEVEAIKNGNEKAVLECQCQVTELNEKVQEVIGKQSLMIKPDPP